MLGQYEHAANCYDSRHRQLRDCRPSCGEARQDRIPQNISQPGSHCAGNDCEKNPFWKCVELAHPERQEHASKRHRLNEILGSRQCRVGCSTATQRITSPRHSCDQHKNSASRTWCIQSGSNKHQKPRERNGESEPLHPIRPLPFGDSPADHRELHGRKKDETTSSRREIEIGKRERRRIAEQQSTGYPAPAAVQLHSLVSKQRDQAQHDRPAHESDERKARRIDRSVCKRQPAKD